jgi:hypothetical protein
MGGRRAAPTCPLTCNEIARIFNCLSINPSRSLARVLHWSHWRLEC